MNQSFFLRAFFHSSLAILEPQIYIVLEQFGAENISLLSSRLVLQLKSFLHPKWKSVFAPIDIVFLVEKS